MRTGTGESCALGLGSYADGGAVRTWTGTGEPCAPGRGLGSRAHRDWGANAYPAYIRVNNFTQFFMAKHRFQPQNPLAGAQQFVSRDPQEDDELKLCSHTMTLPSRGQLEARMIVTAFEHGLDNVTEDAVTIVIHALEHGNQGKHRVTKRGPALSYPMFTLVTSEDIAGSVSHTPIQRCQQESSDEIKFWTLFSDQRSPSRDLITPHVNDQLNNLFSAVAKKHLKNLLTSVVSRRQAYRLKDGHFRYAFGCNINPQPYLRNSVATYNQLLDWESVASFFGLKLWPPPLGVYLQHSVML
ncbi:unnamed protein product [Ranitomeya imitator]|uniref:Uncharacterized protein n=1 Tax=Ranitomeya imitator TaxID=111125 RepID=A0ABN9KVR3_9NEOB|nr:unnamed protein product [Ranitomeya imitator]